MAAEPVFTTVNQELLVEKLLRAERHACYVGPGIHDWAAEALIDVWPRLGPDKVIIVTDPSPFVVQVGYGTEGALQRLQDRGIPVRIQPGLRIGIIIADDFAAVFGPAPYNIEELPKTNALPNAVVLNTAEASRLLTAIAPELRRVQEFGDEASTGPATDEQCNSSESQGLGGPEIGIDVLSKPMLERIHRELTEHPPVAPDLERQMRVLNSTFQVIKITFTGAKLAQRRLPLKAEELGIEEAELKRRIGANFKLFESDVEFLTKDLHDDLESLKRKYNLKSVGEIGHLVLSRDRVNLENALRMFQGNVNEAQNRLKDVIAHELEHSKQRLRQLLQSRLPRENGEIPAWRLDAVIQRMKFPKPEEVLSKLECDWHVFNLSEQMINKADFAEKVKALYGKPIEELTAVESAVGVRQSSPLSG